MQTLICGVYRIQIGGYFYFGSSLNIKERLREHLRLLKKGTHGNKKMQRVFSRCREFHYDIMDITTEEDRIGVEQWYIDQNFGRRFSMNLSSDAKSGFACKETRRKTAERNRRMEWTPEMRENLASKRRGTKATPELRARLSESRKGHLNSNSKITKDQTRQILMERRNGALTNDLALKFGVHPSSIQRLCVAHGVKARPKKWTPTQRASIMNARKRNPNWNKRDNTGSKNGRSILTESSVIVIKGLISEGKPCSEIALLFGVKKGAIEAIKSGRNWSHLIAEYARRKQL